MWYKIYNLIDSSSGRDHLHVNVPGVSPDWWVLPVWIIQLGSKNYPYITTHITEHTFSAHKSRFSQIFIQDKTHRTYVIGNSMKYSKQLDVDKDIFVWTPPTLTIQRRLLANLLRGMVPSCVDIYAITMISRWNVLVLVSLHSSY